MIRWMIATETLSVLLSGDRHREGEAPLSQTPPGIANHDSVDDCHGDSVRTFER